MNFLSSFPAPAIIAEIGARYADMATLKAIVSSAKACGADLVKFQTYRAETITTPGSFFTFEDGSQVPQFEFFKNYELSRDDHQELDGHCKEIGIGWLSTPSHPSDVELLETFDPIAYKTGSDDLTNIGFLSHIAERGRPMIVSTGMATLAEVERAVESVTHAGNDQLILLHCVVSYPSRPEDANLKAIETLRRAFGFPVGLSDHTRDGFTSVLAAALGAVVIEKHYTMDYALKLPDADAALDEAGLAKLVSEVRRVPEALGDGVKRILPTEEKWRKAARKSLFSARTIEAGQTIAASDIAVRRPSDGIHPHHAELVIGRCAKVRIPADTLISWEMI